MTMRAVQQSGWGAASKVLSVSDAVPLPPSPASDELGIKVRSVSIHPGDRHVIKGRPYLVRLVLAGKPWPTIPGMDFAGVVEAVGERAGDRFSVGDEVFGTTDLSLGAFAEHLVVKEGNVAIKPASVSWEEAASVATSGLTALQATRTGRPLEPNDKVLVNGASGGVGCFAVQLAKARGCEVTAVCSAEKADLVKSLGADVVVDYRGDVEQQLSGLSFDKILDLAGRGGWRPLLKREGDYVAVALPNPKTECIPCTLLSVLCCFPTRGRLFKQTVDAGDLEELARMLDGGELRAHVGLKLEGLEQLVVEVMGENGGGKTTVTL